MTEFLLMPARAEEVGDQPRTQDREASPQRARLIMAAVTPRDVRTQILSHGRRVVGHMWDRHRRKMRKEPKG